MNVRRQCRSLATTTLTSTVVAVCAAGVLAGQQPAAAEVAGPGVSNQVHTVALEPVAGQGGQQVDPTSSMAAYLTASFTDVDQTWIRLFAGWGYAAPTARALFPAPGQSVTSCGKASNDSTMQYCPTDDTITFSEQAATDMWTGRYNRLQVAGAAGMSVTLLVAHEYGHNIEAELGRWGTASRADQAARERGADCFAGVWAQDAAGRGLLTQDDVTAAYAALDEAAEHPEVGITDQGVHGTRADRQQAYETGANQGAKACVDTYLATLAGSSTTSQPRTDQTTSRPSGTGEVSGPGLAGRQDPTQITLR